MCAGHLRAQKPSSYFDPYASRFVPQAAAGTSVKTAEAEADAGVPDADGATVVGGSSSTATSQSESARENPVETLRMEVDHQVAMYSVDPELAKPMSLSQWGFTRSHIRIRVVGQHEVPGRVLKPDSQKLQKCGVKQSQVLLGIEVLPIDSPDKDDVKGDELFLWVQRRRPNPLVMARRARE